MTSDTIRVGFIGAGGIAKSRHLPNLQSVPNVKLVAVANRREESARKIADAFGFQKVYKQWKNLVDDPEVDAVFICTPPSLHREMTLYSLEKDKHVFCQARMAMDLEEAKQMLETDHRSLLTTMLCPAPLYMGVEPFVQRFLNDGRLGEIRHVVINHPSSSFLDPSLPLHWRQRKDIQGINTLEVGMMAEVMGRWFVPVRKLCAMAKTWVHQRPADADGMTQVEIPDSVTVIGEFTSGALLTANFTNAVLGGEPMMVIHGDKGSLTCYPTEPYVIHDNGSNKTKIEVPHEQLGAWQVESQFIEAVINGRKGSPSFEDGVRYMRFTQAVIDSIATGKLIELDEL